MEQYFDDLFSTIAMIVDGGFQVLFNKNWEGDTVVEISINGFRVQTEIAHLDKSSDWIRSLNYLYSKIYTLKNNPICKGISDDGEIELRSPCGKKFYIRQIVNGCAYLDISGLEKEEIPDLISRLLTPYDDYYDMSKAFGFNSVKFKFKGRNITVAQYPNEIPPNKSVILSTLNNTIQQTCLNELENN